MSTMEHTYFIIFTERERFTKMVRKKNFLRNLVFVSLNFSFDFKNPPVIITFIVNSLQNLIILKTYSSFQNFEDVPTQEKVFEWNQRVPNGDKGEAHEETHCSSKHGDQRLPRVDQLLRLHLNTQISFRSKFGSNQPLSHWRWPRFQSHQWIFSQGASGLDPPPVGVYDKGRLQRKWD